jgi:hypothetical protein
MKLFDCFKFFNEFELLHLRFLEYYDFVDYFVLVESPKSHTGKPKPLYYHESKARFKEFNDKVIHVIVNDLPDYSLDNIWIAENFQRNCIMRGLDGKAQSGDKIFISDCDEFWDTETAKKHMNEAITFQQDLYYYYVNCKQKQIWNGTIMAFYGTFDSPQYLRNIARCGYNVKYPGGWHYSFMGGADRIKQKVENIAESHLIVDKIGTIEEIQKKMATSRDLWDRTEEYAQKQIVPLQYIPKSLPKFLMIYPDFYRISL